MIALKAGMIVYRLYTEQRENLSALVSSHFDGFTMFYTLGFWQGAREMSVCVEILGTPADRARILILAEDIRQTNAQHSVLVSVSPCELFNVTFTGVTEV